MKLWEIAKQSLEANTVQTASGPITVAGSHQFKTFWVRDFCFAVPGLLALGHHEQVRKQLAIALDHQRADGLIARGFDVINPKLRVVAESFEDVAFDVHVASCGSGRAWPAAARLARSFRRASKSVL